MEIKEILYIEIDKIGKNSLSLQISKDIKNTIIIIDKILSACLPQINNLHNDSEEDGLVVLSEALLHFLLTISIIPSERKIVFDNTKISIIIPSQRSLKDHPDNVLILRFLKDKSFDNTNLFDSLYKIQPNPKNIWIISSRPIKSNFVNFVINPYKGKLNDGAIDFNQIIDKINAFLIQINYSGLKIL